VEAASLPSIDSVLTFAELAALFVAKGVDVKEMPVVEEPVDSTTYADCRGFALPQGVARAVVKRSETPFKTMQIDGLDKKTVRLMKIWPKRPPEADLVEVMCCEGGCLAGPGVLVNPKIANRLRQGIDVATVGTRPLEAKRHV
jgi:iron only hydrogenase large subunit-like protein